MSVLNILNRIRSCAPFLLETYWGVVIAMIGGILVGLLLSAMIQGIGICFNYLVRMGI